MCNLGNEACSGGKGGDGALALAEMQLKVTDFKPEDFIRANQPNSSKSLSLLRCLYDFTKQQESQATSVLSSVTFGNLGKDKKSKKRKRTLLSTTERPVDRLIVDSFDADQIWQELQLQNDLIYDTLVSSTSRILAKNRSFNANQAAAAKAPEKATKRKFVDQPEEDFEESESEDDEDVSVIEFEGLKSNKESRLGKQKHSQSYPKSEVDDKFFNLAQMTEFLEKVEAQMESTEPEDVDSEDDIDMFEDIDEGEKEAQGEDEDESNVYYDKFFDKPLDDSQPPDKNLNKDFGTGVQLRKSKTVQWNLGKESDNNEIEDDENEEELDDDEEVENEEEDSDIEDGSRNTKQDEPSNFEKRRRKIEENIEQIEQAALEAKAWKYQGEITAEKRPENSLLEEHLVYDSLVRAAPEITVETTQKLEDIIKQRIKDKAWDDVERKFKPVEDPSEYKKKIVLSTEKSKMSLAQIYEQEYIEKQKAEEGETEVESKPEEEAVIERDMKSLFTKLDALSNFHYTPKPVSTEIKIVTNVPAIAMEEVAPVNVADSMLLAPQEIQAPTKGEVKGKDERTDTDRKRERRIKKKKQKFIHKAKEEKEKLKEARFQAKLNSKMEEKQKGPSRKNQIKFK